jgi:hypothetical protein
VRLPAPGRAPPSPERRVASQDGARRASYRCAPGHASAADGIVPGEQCTASLPSRLEKSRAAPSAGESFVPLFLPGQLRPSLSILVPIADPELSCFSLILRSRQPSPNNPNRKTLRLDLCAFLPIASCVDLGWGAGFMLCDLVLCVVPVAELPRRWRQ